MDRGMSFYAGVTALSVVIVPILINLAFKTDVLARIPAKGDRGPLQLTREFSSIDLIDTERDDLVATLTDFVADPVCVTRTEARDDGSVWFHLPPNSGQGRKIIYEGKFQMRLVSGSSTPAP